MAQINTLVASQRLAFYSEVLDRVWPGDPVHDDLTELFAPYVPGTAVVAQLDAPAGALDAFHPAAPAQDYRLSVDSNGVSVTRDAPTDGLPEVVVARIDRETWTRPGTPRNDWKAAAWVETVNLSRGQLYAAGFLTLRQYDTPAGRGCVRIDSRPGRSAPGPAELRSSTWRRRS